MANPTPSTPASAPSRVQNVFVVAREPGALHAFYESALGLPLKFRDGDRWLQYGVGPTNVALACAIATGEALRQASISGAIAQA